MAQLRLDASFSSVSQSIHAAIDHAVACVCYECAEHIGIDTDAQHQIEFIDMIINRLTEHGAMDPGLLYESPYTDISPFGPEGVFDSDQVDAMIAVLESIQQSAAA